MKYQSYVSLLSKRINQQADKQDLKMISDYESSQPEKCPNCGERVRSQFLPSQIVHDIEDCKKPMPEPYRKTFDED